MRAQRRRATVRDSGKRGATTQALRRARSSQGTIGLLHLSVKPFYVNITPRDEIEHTRRNKGKHTRTRRLLSNHFPSLTPNPFTRVETIDSAKLRAMRCTAGSSSLKKLRGSLANSNSPRKTKF